MDHSLDKVAMALLTFLGVKNDDMHNILYFKIILSSSAAQERVVQYYLQFCKNVVSGKIMSFELFVIFFVKQSFYRLPIHLLVRYG